MPIFVKVFPASTWTPQAIVGVLEALPHLPLVPTGGVTSKARRTGSRRAPSRSGGAKVGTTTRSEAVIQVLPHIARELDIEIGETVVELERLRTVDGSPFMLERTWLPTRLVPGLAETGIGDEGLYQTLRSRYGLVLVRAVESFEPVLLHADEADALQQEPNHCALMLTRTTYDEQDRPVETARAILRADRCRTLVERRVHEPDRP